MAYSPFIYVPLGEVIAGALSRGDFKKARKGGIYIRGIGKSIIITNIPYEVMLKKLPTIKDWRKVYVKIIKQVEKRNVILVEVRILEEIRTEHRKQTIKIGDFEDVIDSLVIIYRDVITGDVFEKG